MIFNLLMMEENILLCVLMNELQTIDFHKRRQKGKGLLLGKNEREREKIIFLYDEKINIIE